MLLLACASPAAAAPACANPPQKTVLYDGYGILESVIVDSQGRLYFTDTANDRVMRADAPGAQPQPLAGGISEPGGMSFLPDGDLIVGTGTTIPNGLLGNTAPAAGLVRIDPDTGAKSGYAAGLQQANGVEAGPQGEIYASNDVGLAGIDRIGPGGAPVQRQWSSVVSANGIVVDSAGESLYAAQTFVAAAIQRVRLSNPSQVETFLQAGPADFTAGLDGMVRDEHDQLYVTANSGGQVWKVSNPGAQYCSLGSFTPLGPSAVAFGRSSTGFRQENLYVVTFNGEVIELAGVRAAVPAPAPGGTGATARPPDATYAARKRKCAAKKSKKKRKRCKRKRRKRRR